MPRKIHLHSEQFDNHLHAECGRFAYDPAPSEPMAEFIVSEDAFSELPRAARCRYCTRYWWPHGGDPK